MVSPSLCCIQSLVITPMFGKYTNWNEEWSSSIAGCCCITFEASCREDFHVAISSECRSTDKMCQIVGGAHGNTEAVIRFGPRDSSTVFCGRICSSTEFKAFWILLKNDLVSFGIGKEVGKSILLKKKLTISTEAKYVSFSSWRAPVEYRNININCGSNAPDIDPNVVEPLIFFNSATDNDNLLSEEILQEFQKTCDQALRRATRFGSTYVVPDIKKFLPAEQVRRMQRSGAVEPGFVTGFDMNSEAEKIKRESRMKRFDTPSFGIEFNTETGRAMNKGIQEEDWKKLNDDKNLIENRKRKFGVVVNSKIDLIASSSKVLLERCDLQENAVLRKDAIHLYSLDNDFQRVRTKDIFSYFNGYGPSYIEWINSSSCIVVFEDENTASRALTVLSEEISEDFDTENKELVLIMIKNGWRYGNLLKKRNSELYRILLRFATEQDFPKEKSTKTYFREKKKRRKSFDKEINYKESNKRKNLSSKRLYFNDDGSISRRRKEDDANIEESIKDSHTVINAAVIDKVDEIEIMEID